METTPASLTGDSVEIKLPGIVSDVVVGANGRYLFLPPGYEGEVPGGYFTAKSTSYVNWLILRGFLKDGKPDFSSNLFRTGLKVYPLATGPREGNFTNGTGAGTNSLAPEDGSAFEMLNEIVQYEPEELFGAEGGYSDFFENLFGRAARQQAGDGAGDQQFYYEARPRRGQDSEHALQVTLDEAFHGTKRVFEWEDGRKIDAKIPRGVKTGSRVRLKGQGDPGIGGGKAGDLYLIIEVLPDNRFQRDNDDLATTVAVDLFTMLLGGKLSVPGIDRMVKLDIAPETRNGRVFRLRGLGMPKIKHSDQRGDLYVTVEAVLPQHLTAGEKELVEQWKNMR